MLATGPISSSSSSSAVREIATRGLHATCGVSSSKTAEGGGGYGCRCQCGEQKRSVGKWEQQQQLRGLSSAVVCGSLVVGVVVYWWSGVVAVACVISAGVVVVVAGLTGGEQWQELE